MALPPIGARLRAERVRRGVSVRGLAREIGVSASLISQIETEKSSPSVSTLYAIATALGVPIEDLFGEAPVAPAAAFPPDAGEPDLEDGSALPGVSTVDVLGGGGTALLTALATAQAGAPRLGPVVAPAQREVLTLDSGVTWELLGRVPDKHVDFLLITYRPGGTSSSDGNLMRHSGTEFGFVVSGELTLTLGFDTHRLRAGDSVSFDSTTPHAYRNESTEPAIGVWFVLERSS